MNQIQQGSRKFSYLLSTGQITSYGSGSGADDGALRVGTPKAYQIETVGRYSGTTTIVVNGKSDIHSNNVVIDLNVRNPATGNNLMWSRYASASVGAASDGKLEWTSTGAGGTLQGLFPYCAAANVALLAGYGDWRVPNEFEAMSLFGQKTADAYPNPTAFPSPPTDIWTSTTRGQASGNAFNLRFNIGDAITLSKTSTSFVLLVRG